MALPCSADWITIRRRSAKRKGLMLAKSVGLGLCCHAPPALTYLSRLVMYKVLNTPQTLH